MLRCTKCNRMSKCKGTVTLSLIYIVSVSHTLQSTPIWLCLLQAGTNVNVWVHWSTSHLRLLTWSPGFSLDHRICCGDTSGTWCHSGTCSSRKCHSTCPAGCSTWSWLGCPCRSVAEHCVGLVHARIVNLLFVCIMNGYMLLVLGGSSGFLQRGGVP